MYRWQSFGSFPEARRRRRRPSLIDPYERYVLTWWQAGNRNGSQLYRELISRGYKGSAKAMYNYLATLRAPQSGSCKSTPSRPQERKRIPPSPAPLENFSAQRATWLFVCQPGELDERQQAELALLRQASPSAEIAYALAQAFMHMIWEQTGELAERGSSEPLARVGVICQRDPTRQSGGGGRIDLALEYWSSRRACEPAQASEKEHVWPRQAPAPASTCAACGGEQVREKPKQMGNIEPIHDGPVSRKLL